MFKFLCSLFLIFILSANAAEEKSYVFEAKGKFAEDLKALVEKYSQDGKVEVNVYENKEAMQSESKTVTQKIISVFSKDDAESLKYADVAQGEKIYKSKCASCHGEKADDNRYAVQHKLADLKPMQILTLLQGYSNNYEGNFGGSLRQIMIPQAQSLVSDEMQSVAVYIYSIKHGKDLPSTPVNNEEESSNESKSSYLQ